jgi:hypothetical protein
MLPSCSLAACETAGAAVSARVSTGYGAPRDLSSNPVDK